MIGTIFTIPLPQILQITTSAIATTAISQSAEQLLICLLYTSRCVEETDLKEQLYVCIPKEHKLAEYSQLILSQLNGFNCLLRDEIGFWTNLVKSKMPASVSYTHLDVYKRQTSNSLLSRTWWIFFPTGHFWLGFSWKWNSSSSGAHSTALYTSRNVRCV